jgi:peptidoglycan biosynthesis protein MviN/MurJ (putative lipid II flippase)
VLLNLALSALLWGPFGVEGLAAAVSIASWAEWALLYRAYARRTGAPWREDVAALANFAVCGAVMGLVLGGSFAFLETGGQVTSLVTGVAGAVAGAAVYAGLASFLRLPEFVAALERAVRLVRRGGAS